MQLTPSEPDRLLLFTAAELARARRARGLRLNVPEATALVADTVCEAARDGARLADAVAAGRSVLGPRRRAARRGRHRRARCRSRRCSTTARVWPWSPTLRWRPGRRWRLAAGDRPGEVADAAPERRRTTTCCAPSCATPATCPSSVTSATSTSSRSTRDCASTAAARYGRHLASTAGTAPRFDPGRPTRGRRSCPIGGDRVVDRLRRARRRTAGRPGRVRGRDGAARATGFLDWIRSGRGGRVMASPSSTSYGLHAPGDRIRLGDTGPGRRGRARRAAPRLRVPHRLRQDRPGRHASEGRLRSPRPATSSSPTSSSSTRCSASSRCRSASATAGSHAIGRAGNPDTHGRRRRRRRHRHRDRPRRRADRDGGRDRHPRAPAVAAHLEAALASGVTTILGQEFGPSGASGVNSPWALRHRVRRLRRLAGQHRLPGPRLVVAPGAADRGAREAGACGFKVHEDLGAHARAPRHRAARRRGPRRAGRAAHRRPQREPLRGGHAARSWTGAPSTRSTSRAAAAGTCRTC